MYRHEQRILSRRAVPAIRIVHSARQEGLQAVVNVFFLPHEPSARERMKILGPPRGKIGLSRLGPGPTSGKNSQFGQ